MKDRRKCRKFAPIVFLMLQPIGIAEGLVIGYILAGGNKYLLVASIAISFYITYLSFIRTKEIYQNRCVKRGKNASVRQF